MSIERINWIDWAKVFGIWLVVYGHTPGHIMGDVIFLFHVPLFFILSGMLYKKRSFLSELKRSSYSLLLPYLFYSIFVTILTGPIQLLNYQHLFNILTGNQEGLDNIFRPMWFVVAIFVIRVFISIFNNKVWLGGAISVVVFLIMKCTGFIGYEHDYFQLGTSMLCTGFMVIGYYLKNEPRWDIVNKIKVGKFWKVSLLLICMFVFVIIGLLNCKYAPDKTYGAINVFRCATGYNVFLFAIVALALSYIFIKLTELLFPHKNSFVEILSTGTLLILCIHQFIVTTVSNMLGYNTVSALILATSVVAISYYFILLSKKYFPLLIGKKFNK